MSLYIAKRQYRIAFEIWTRLGNETGPEYLSGCRLSSRLLRLLPVCPCLDHSLVRELPLQGFQRSST